MEIPSHQRQPDELTAEEIIDDKYVIIFLHICYCFVHYDDVNIDIIWPPLQ